MRQQSKPEQQRSAFSNQSRGEVKPFVYGKAKDKRIQKDWLTSKDINLPVQKYREYLMIAMVKARDNFQKRLEDQN